MKPPVQTFARLGWWLFMEIGFAELIDKFEKYYGKFLTRLVLGLAGLAFATFCMRIIWSYGIDPILSLSAFKNFPKAPIESIWLGAAFAIGAGIGTALIAAVLNWRLSRRIGQLESRLKEVSDMAEMAALAPARWG